ncbi:hypothetical protein ACWEO2_27870 [Nocardia sp. NPDC004278]
MMVVADVLAAVMVAVMAYRLRWWRSRRESRPFTAAFGVVCAALIIGAPPVDEYIDRWSLQVIGSATAILIAVLLMVGAYCIYATVALSIIAGTPRFTLYNAAAWLLTSAVLVISWLAGDASKMVAGDPLGLPDLSSRIFTLTYAGLMAVAWLATLITTWKALQRKDLRPRLRRAAWGLFATAACAIGLAVSLVLNAVVLHMPLQNVENLELAWWVPAFIGLAIAGL